MRSTKEEFVTRSKNNPKCRDCEGNYFNYDYVNYIDAKTEVDIYCNYHNKLFPMIPNNHSSHGQICVSCSKNKQYSETACEWIEGIMKNEGINIQYAKSEEGEYHIPGTRFKAHGYCEETNTIYEFIVEGAENAATLKEIELRERGYNYICILKSKYIKKRKREYHSTWTKQKKKDDPTFKLVCNLRGRLLSRLKAAGANKNKSTLEYHSATIEEIYKHLESQFKDGMNWENMGTKLDGTPGWDIDHRKLRRHLI